LDEAAGWWPGAAGQVSNQRVKMNLKNVYPHASICEDGTDYLDYWFLDVSILK